MVKVVFENNVMAGKTDSGQNLSSPFLENSFISSKAKEGAGLLLCK